MLKNRIHEYFIKIRGRTLNYLCKQLDNHNSVVNILLITNNNRISSSQIFPFYFYQVQLIKKYNATITEIDVKDALELDASRYSDIDLVFIQPWFDISDNNLNKILEDIQKGLPKACKVFLDSYAPLDLRLAEKVNDYVDIYVKKHVFRDRARYGIATQGDTNLAEYYSGLYGIPCSEKRFVIPEGFLDKLVVGPSFFSSRMMLPHFAGNNKLGNYHKSIDVHARLGGVGDGWYGNMRAHALKAVCAIPSISTIKGTGVKLSKYIEELKHSKICFSPFGYGEVCWRDYEAIMCGALLVKPDMSHVETDPDIFIPYVTYIPIQWDFTDLNDKISYYLDNAEERNEIVQNAYSRLQQYASNGEFINFVEKIISRSRTRINIR